ncbi:MAG: peptide/nickel transport system substrate-binding protein [Frankiales bacterium]|nr:peptide/nickel transport system substrate-binding protein [Frankiales bacterium]
MSPAQRHPDLPPITYDRRGSGRTRSGSVGIAVAASIALATTACSSSTHQTPVANTSRAAGTTGTTGGGPADRVLRLSFLQDPGQPPDPDVFYAGQGLALTLNAYEGLLTYKLGTATPTIVGQLATAWTVSPDKSTYTLTLRQGVTFHDGTTFDASAVKASFDRRLAVNQGPAYMVSDVVSVTAPSPYKVIIKLKGPNSAFLDYLAAPYGPKMMSPTGLATNAGKDHDQTYLQTHDLGTGAYTITTAKVGQQYSLAAYPQWWGGKVYFTGIDLPVVGDLSTQQLEFQKGQLAAILHDLNGPAVKSMLADTKISTYALPTFNNQELFINPASGFLGSKANRNAFQQALNIPALVNSVFKGRATVPDSIYAKGLLPAGMGAQNITFDPSKLKAAVAAAPAADRTLVLGYDTSMPDDQQLADLVSATFAAYGLTIKVQGFTTSQIFGWVGDPKGAPNALFETFWPDAAHPYTTAHITWAADGGVNLMHCSDPAITALLPKALASGSEEEFSTLGTEAVSTGCWTNVAQLNDFMVAQKWLKGVAESHDIAAPQTLIFSGLSAG